MTTQNSSIESSSTITLPEPLILERILNAPRDLVFKAWTDQIEMAQWWGPRYFTNPVCELDVRPGGAILIHMQGPDGTVFPMEGEFLEVTPVERIVMATTALDSLGGNPLLEEITTVTFEEHNGKTKLTVHARITNAVPEAAGALAGMEEGWNQTLDKLVEFVAAA